jgi:hypothetical protein
LTSLYASGQILENQKNHSFQNFLPKLKTKIDSRAAKALASFEKNGHEEMFSKF